MPLNCPCWPLGMCLGATEFSISSVLTLVPHLWDWVGTRETASSCPSQRAPWLGLFSHKRAGGACQSSPYFLALLPEWPGRMSDALGNPGLGYLRWGCLRPGCPGLGCWGVQGRSAQGWGARDLSSQGWGVRGWARPQDSTPCCFVFSVVSWEFPNSSASPRESGWRERWVCAGCGQLCPVQARPLLARLEQRKGDAVSEGGGTC